MKDGERSLRRAKSGETLVEASSDTDAQIVCYTLGFGENTTHAQTFCDVLMVTSCERERETEKNRIKLEKLEVTVVSYSLFGLTVFLWF